MHYSHFYSLSEQRSGCAPLEPTVRNPINYSKKEWRESLLRSFIFCCIQHPTKRLGTEVENPLCRGWLYRKLVAVAFFYCKIGGLVTRHSVSMSVYFMCPEVVRTQDTFIFDRRPQLLRFINQHKKRTNCGCVGDQLDSPFLGQKWLGFVSI